MDAESQQERVVKKRLVESLISIILMILTIIVILLSIGPYKKMELNSSTEMQEEQKFEFEGEIISEEIVVPSEE